MESKLLSLQRLIGDTELASSQGWRALMDEDRLLTRFKISSNEAAHAQIFRVEILESQLTTYGKAMTEDKLREETKRLMCDKESYQTAAKENLKRLVDEKLEASKRLKEVCIVGCSKLRPNQRFIPPSQSNPTGHFRF